MSGVAKQRQNYFKPLTLDQEAPSVLQRAVSLRSIIQIKDETTYTGGDYTRIQPTKLDRTVINSRHVTGPAILGTLVTLMFEVDKTKYFAQAKVLNRDDEGYQLKLANLFELQRRNFFRVSLPQNMFDAKFVMPSVRQPLPLLDLGIGGAGVAFQPSDMKAFEIGITIGGMIRIAGFDALPVQFKVKHRRRRAGERGPYSFFAGCEFFDLNESTKQKLAVIVNDCHRMFFIRMKK